MSPRLNLLVLYSRDVERLRYFYENFLKFSFVKEKHGNGAEHYSCQLGELVLELYPTSKENTHTTRLGFAIEGLDELIKKLDCAFVHRSPFETDYGRCAIIQDPDDRFIHLYEHTTKLKE